MKKNYYIRFLPLALLLASVGCGGGGGDGRTATNVSGTWTGALTKVSDSCTVKSPSTINVSHGVSQNEDAVTLQSEAGVQFLGNTVGENGFSVNATHASGASCSDQTQIAYDSINNDTDPTADVDITINRSCSGQAACLITFTGTLSRSVSTSGTPVPTATPVPGTTATPITLSGGCTEMNTHPAAGTYSGDGGCGISDSAFSVQGSTVVLSPFGVNGATSFNVSNSNTSSAASQNTDLTISGTAGYACNMVCSPPGTFTVQCFKEGGTTCVEKF